MKKQLDLLTFTTFLIAVKMVVSFNVQTVTQAGTCLGNKKFLSVINREVEVYLGIPYAEPPIGDRRFKDPVPLPKIQSKTFGMEIFPPSCPQEKFEIFSDFNGTEDWKIKSTIEEDCLYLNIWKPAYGPGSKPVMFWIHGGGFTYGSTSTPLHDGSHLAAYIDAVVVTIQYRLGAFGLLYTGDDFAPGNAGLKDQVLALKWVSEHIHHFGGDRNKITIVGGSSGGFSTGILVLSPKASKLYKRAILLSGTPNNPFGISGPSVAYLKTLELASRLGADVRDLKGVKKYLQGNWFTIVGLQNDLKKNLKVNFLPVVEPVLVPEHPLHLIKKANHLRDKELIVSWTKDEGSMYLAFELKLENKINEATEMPFIYKEHFLEKLNKFVEGDSGKAEQLAKLYNETGERPFLKGLVKLYSDVYSKCSINQFIEEARKHGGKVYQLEYDYRTLKNNLWPEWFGAFHTADVEMLFGQPIYDRQHYNSIDNHMGMRYLNRMKSFVDTGNPNVEKEESWYADKMFVFTHVFKSADTRTEICTKLKKIIPNFLSVASTPNWNIIGITSILILLRSIF